MACNLIRRKISPNQDDLSYSTRSSFPATEIGLATKHSLFGWTTPASADVPLVVLQQQQHGAYLIYGFLAPISDQGIPVEYELDTFNTPPQEQLNVTPKIGYVDAMPLFRSRHLALNSPLGHFIGDNAPLSPNPPDTQNSRWLQSSFPPTASMAFAKLRRTQSLARLTTRAAFSTLSYLHFVSLLTIFPYETCSTNANYIFHAANKKNYS